MHVPGWVAYWVSVFGYDMFFWNKVWEFSLDWVGCLGKWHDISLLSCDVWLCLIMVWYEDVRRYVWRVKRISVLVVLVLVVCVGVVQQPGMSITRRNRQ